MTVVELIEALIPYGDEANVYVVVKVEGKFQCCEHFEVRSDDNGDVAFLAYGKETAWQTVRN